MKPRSVSGPHRPADEVRTEWHGPEDAGYRIEQAIAALTLIGDGMAIPLDWCGLADDEVQAVRRALDSLDTAKLELSRAVALLLRRSGEDGP